ncbi:MAG: hypothetical protein GY917_01545, partial [Planctomycetaceae bacterium]|nr:hypothetical protein [Planctomycetaceae bacterium]
MSMRFLYLLILLTGLLGLADRASAQRTARTVFNDDAQVLMETPEKGATKFVQ